jgi:hypothetical protein
MNDHLASLSQRQPDHGSAQAGSDSAAAIDRLADGVGVAFNWQCHGSHRCGGGICMCLSNWWNAAGTSTIADHAVSFDV